MDDIVETLDKDTNFFVSKLNKLGFANKKDIDILLKNLSEEEAYSLVEYLMPESNIYIVFESNTTKYGYTFPMFEDSCIIPSGHRIHISNPNALVITHELSHILDFDRKPHDCHDCVFEVYWIRLLKRVVLLIMKDK